jgi:hypothetical protein
MEAQEIILNDDFETVLHYLVSEFDTESESYYPIGVVKADYKQNCYSKLLECVLFHTKAKVIKEFELYDSDSVSFHIYEVTMIIDDDNEEEIRTYNVELIPIF